MSARAARAAVLLFALALALAGLARAEVTQKGNLRVAVSGKLSPHALPRFGAAPVSVSVAGRISTTDESLPPQLKSLRIEINRHGRLDTAGLPLCHSAEIRTASSARALAACRPSLLGQGSFQANIVLSGQEPYPTRGRLLLFNGARHGRPALLGQIYAPRPFATSFVIPFAVSRIAHGAYGTAFTAQLPRTLGSWGYITAIGLRLSRRYAYRGARHSFLSAACPAPKGFTAAPFPLLRTSFAFAGHLTLTKTLTRSCGVRG